MVITPIDFLRTFVNGRFLELRGVHPHDPRSTPQEFFHQRDLDRIPEFLHAYDNHHLYFGVAERGTPSNGGRLNNCCQCGALFADLDFKLVSEEACRNRLSIFPLQPSIRVHTGGGLHCYWLLNNPYDLTAPGGAHQFKDLLQRLAIALQADPAAAEPARVLRIPGTTNWKYPASVMIEHFDPEHRFDLSDFDFLPQTPRQLDDREHRPDGAPTSDQERFLVMRLPICRHLPAGIN